MNSMPSITQVAQNLEDKDLKYAPKANQEKIKHVIQIYRDRRSVPRHIVEKAVMALYLPSAFGRVGKKGKLGKAEETYEDFVSRYQDDNSYPTDLVRSWRYTDKLQDRQDRLQGIERNYQLMVVLFTQARQQDPKEKPFQQDEAVERIIQKRSRTYENAKSTRACGSTGRDT